MKTITTLLQESACEYKICTTKEDTYELFYVHGKVETVRSTSSTEREVTVYVDHDGRKGEYAFKISPSDTEEKMKAKIESAVSQAALVNNEAFTLPENETMDEVIPSNFDEMSMSEVASKIGKAVFKADKYEGGSINALEVFVYKTTYTVENSHGLKKSEHKYSAMVEAIPTWNEAGESVELYECFRFTSFDEDYVTNEIAHKMEEVRDRYHAKKPEAELTVPVVLRAPELASLLSNYVRQANYANVYAKTVLFKEGDDFQKGEKDKLTVEMKGTMEGSSASALFDSDGVTLKDRTVISGGKISALYGANRFAQYLKKEATGNLSCMKVHTGTLSEEELTKAPYFECASMSGLQVDLFSDYIGGEVRLGYYFDGEKKIPVTGISISGKLSEVLPTLRLSTKETLSGSYFGPDRALFEKIRII